MNPKQAKDMLVKRWPWVALAAPLLALGADNLIGPTLSGQAAQRAFQAAVEAAIGPRFDRLDKRLDDIRPCREWRR